MNRPDIEFDGESFRPRSAAGDAFLSREFSNFSDLLDDISQTEMADICARAELAGLVVRRVCTVTARDGFDHRDRT
jgi:hypothetical protein